MSLKPELWLVTHGFHWFWSHSCKHEEIVTSDQLLAANKLLRCCKQEQLATLHRNSAHTALHISWKQETLLLRRIRFFSLNLNWFMFMTWTWSDKYQFDKNICFYGERSWPHVSCGTGFMVTLVRPLQNHCKEEIPQLRISETEIRLLGLTD